MELEEYIQRGVYSGMLSSSALVGLPIEISLAGLLAHRTTITDVQICMYDMDGEKARCESITLPLEEAFSLNGKVVDRVSFSFVLSSGKLVLCCKDDDETLQMGELIDSGFSISVARSKSLW